MSDRSPIVNSVVLSNELWTQIYDALVAADSILSLLHHRHRNELSELNRQDVEAALKKVTAVSRDLKPSAYYGTPDLEYPD